MTMVIQNLALFVKLSLIALQIKSIKLQLADLLYSLKQI